MIGIDPKVDRSKGMLRSRHALLGLLVSLAAILAVVMRPSAAQTASSRAAAEAAARNAPTAAANGEAVKAARVNNWTLGIAAGLLEGSFIRFAAELAKALDDGENLRIMPIVTYGAVENIADLLYLKGVDIAITHADVFDLYKKSGEAKNVEQRVNYISQMHNTEFYVLARGDIKSVEDLAGKKVGFHAKGSGPSVTGPMVFERLGIQVEPVYINHTLAIEKMKTGEIAAIFQLGAKPNDLLAKLKPAPGFHFVPLNWGPKFADYYLPATLTHDDYPDLIASGETVDTLAVPVVLAVYNWPRNSDRFRRVERFVHYYFERFDKLKQPSFHPKWREINLAARVPGWIRYPVADEVLATMGKEPVATGRPVARPVEALAGRSDVNSAPLTNAPLFQEFLEWRQKNQRGQ
jgi:TRAP transporter TAXI family solute receptor